MRFCFLIALGVTFLVDVVHGKESPPHSHLRPTTRAVEIVQVSAATLGNRTASNLRALKKKKAKKNSNKDDLCQPANINQLTTASGIKRILVLRVIALQPVRQEPVGETEIYEAVFGSTSLKSQTEACSKNALQLVESSTGGNNGIMNLEVDAELIVGSNKKTEHCKFMEKVYETAEMAGINLEGTSDYHYIFFVIPIGTFMKKGSSTISTSSFRLKCSNDLSARGEKWIAYGYNKKFPVAVFNNHRVKEVDNQLHEIGHIYGLDHSGEGGKKKEYEDQTGAMGGSNQDTFICYNGAKSWQLGWYKNNQKCIYIDPKADGEPLPFAGAVFTSEVVRLTGVNDYSTGTIPSNIFVVLRVAAGKDVFYAMYNRKDGINRDTDDCPNQVAIVSQKDGLSDKESTLEACLGSRDTFTDKEFSIHIRGNFISAGGGLPNAAPLCLFDTKWAKNNKIKAEDACCKYFEKGGVECCFDADCNFDPIKTKCDTTNNVCICNKDDVGVGVECCVDEDCTDPANPTCDIDEIGRNFCNCDDSLECCVDADCTDPINPKCDTESNICVCDSCNSSGDTGRRALQRCSPVDRRGLQSCEVVCPPGYAEDASGACVDEDECEVIFGPLCFGANEICENSEGSYNCPCRPGYIRNVVGGGCICEDECTPVCGDGFCDKGGVGSESAESCPEDCPPVCGDDFCDEGRGETAEGCASDCFVAPPVCGNGKCEGPLEDVTTCEQDCGNQMCPESRDCGDMCVPLGDCCDYEQECNDGSCILEGYCCPEDRYCFPPTFAQPPVARGDPQIVTFFGFRFECNAEGIFILLKSNSSPFQIQGIFTSVGSDVSASVVTGIAIQDEGYPTVQVSIARNTGSSAIDVNSCPLQIYIDQFLQETVTAEELDSGLSIPDGNGRLVIVQAQGQWGSISYPEHHLSLIFGIDSTESFGCFLFGQRLNYPIAYGGSITPRPGYRSDEHIYGLFGSPYGGIFFTRAGEPYQPASTSAEDTYAYCTEQFCITDDAESLFVYEDGFTFSDLNNCDAAFVPIDIDNVDSEIVTLCGDDVSCRTDAVVGGLDAGRLAIEAQMAEDEERALSSNLRFSPSVIPALQATTVIVTVELISLVANLEGFVVYQMNPETLEQGDSILELPLTGSGFAGDVIYSNELTLEPTSIGQVYALRVIPRINGTEAPNSSLVQTAWSAIRSYSEMQLTASPTPTAASNSSNAPSISSTPTLEPPTAGLPSEAPSGSAVPSGIPSEAPVTPAPVSFAPVTSVPSRVPVTPPPVPLPTPEPSPPSSSPTSDPTDISSQSAAPTSHPNIATSSPTQEPTPEPVPE